MCPSKPDPVLYTIGHSTRSIDDFVELLAAHHIECLVDIRTVPRSRRNPQFTREALAEVLPAHGIRYLHFPDLGGLRKPRRDSPNTGWRNESFRGYADYMTTPAFDEALARLLELSEEAATAIMCAEAVPWRCHRSLVADAASLQGARVEHIISAGPSSPHRLTPFARVAEGRLLYPPDEHSAEDR